MKIGKSLFVLTLCTLFICSCGGDEKPQSDNIEKETVATPEDKPVDEEPPSDPWQVVPKQQFGWITAGTSWQDLSNKYGKKQVGGIMLKSIEGNEIWGTEVKMDSAYNNFGITWKNMKSRDSVRNVYLYKKNSDWSVYGLKVGQTIEDVTKANGKPFTIYGYEIDAYLEGTVKSWEDGNLKDIGIKFKMTNTLPDDEYTDIMGDEGFPSDDPLLIKAGLTVVKIEIPL